MNEYVNKTINYAFGVNSLTEEAKQFILAGYTKANREELIRVATNQPNWNQVIEWAKCDGVYTKFATVAAIAHDLIGLDVPDAVLLYAQKDKFTQKILAITYDFEGHTLKYDPSGVSLLKVEAASDNLSYCKEHGIRLSGPALGRPRKGETRDKAQDYRDECERVEVERRFSLAKRKCGMGLITAKLRETAAHVIAMSILVLNLRKIQCAFLKLLAYILAVLLPQQKMAIVQ